MPTPISVSTQIVPPCSSNNALADIETETPSPGENAGARFGTRESDLDTPAAIARLARRTSGGTDRVFVLDQPSDRILANDRRSLVRLPRPRAGSSALVPNQ